jgi:hypothetical protein
VSGKPDFRLQQFVGSAWIHEIEVMVGTSSQDLVQAGTFTVVPDPMGLAPVKRFQSSVSLGAPILPHGN